MTPPRIAECPLLIEARLLASHASAQIQNGSPATHLLIEVEARHIHARRDIVIPATSHIDTGRWNPLYYVFRHYFGDAVQLGRNFRAQA